MRDVIRRFNQRVSEIRRGKNVPAVTRYGKKMKHRIPVPAVEVVHERPMSKKEIWKRDREGVLNDAREFRRSQPKGRIWWGVEGEKIIKYVKMQDGTKIKVEQLNVQVVAAV